MESDKLVNYYLIPGMGADHRLFTHFDLKYGQMHYLNWIHHGKSKNLMEYAHLMAERIKTENNVLVGSSMGGMVAVEMSKIVNPLATVLVSAPVGRHEFPQILKTFDAIRLHKALTPKQIPLISGLADLFMGFKTPEQRALFYDMLKGNGTDFLHFSVGAVLGWKNTEPPAGRFIQILGSQDKLFKASKINGHHVIEGSGHFTAFEKAREVCDIINEYIREKILPEFETNP
jgi:pimeloyl-ACP methyl ester carboxylesterase